MSSRRFGFITGLEGEYKGGVFKILNHEKIVIGRDYHFAEIVINGDNKYVSRIHCSIEYDINTDMYIVVDLSANGTFINDGRDKIPFGQETHIPRGTSVAIGNRHNIFLLN